MERIEYIEECFYNAFWKAWGYVGMGLAFLVFVITLSFRVPNGVGYKDILESFIMSIVAFVVVLLYNVYDETKKSVFAEIPIRKKNDVVDARIIIQNKEFSDLTDLIVEIYKYRRIFLNGEAEDWITNIEEDGYLKIDGEKIISYDGGSKEIIVASGESGEPFLGNMLEPECECFEGWKYLIYDVVIRVKGKIDNRVIAPKKVSGVLRYTESCEKTYATIQGQKVETITARFQWMNLAP